MGVQARVESQALSIKSAYCQCPHYGRLLAALLRHGASALADHVRLQPGIPLKPMLAHPSKNVSHIFDRYVAANSSPYIYRGTHTDLSGRAATMNDEYDTAGEWQFATSRDCTTVDEVQQFMEEAVKNSCEGLMVKALSGEQARYDIARRSHNWLKVCSDPIPLPGHRLRPLLQCNASPQLKKDYLDGVGDTLDLVVIGAYLGRGKRAGVFGGFLLACRDPDSEQYQALCKLGTGFSDDQLRDLTAELRPLQLAAPRAYYSAGAAPDVWLDAAAVWEVRAADLSLSPAHRAAIGRVAPDKGISLRFPSSQVASCPAAIRSVSVQWVVEYTVRMRRFVRVRPDKRPEQATTAAQVADMYLAQDQVKNSAASLAHYDEFY
ncbi:hypothetical protein HF086_017450 [Spodoptera exigua]|uniref:ATP-dependent DNA ligase family profile domain-containing protein n=1 Tax=Spodoptera exigua TaxID=7107 RepID=A0A922M4E6_SPOEX|nr:hypothetical protein HF086_017450 [Spodoptera exigua]